MVTKWIERKVDDLILGIAPIPYADEEVIELAEGVLDVDIIPGLTPVNFHDLTLIQKLFLILPVLDNEYLDLIGLDVFKSAEKKYREENEDSDDSGVDRGRGVETDGGQDVNNKNRYQRNRRANQRNGNYQNRRGGRSAGTTWNDLEVDDEDGGILSFGMPVSGSTIIKALIAFSFIGIIGVLGITLFSGSMPLLNNLLGSQATTAANTAGDAGQGIVAAASSAVSCATGFQECALNATTNTRRPTAEQSGQEFELKVIDPKVRGGSNRIDVNKKNTEFGIPISFTLKNGREGRYGINASNVKYKVAMYNPGIADDTKICSTDWISVNKAPGTSLSQEQKQRLIPGESFTPRNWQENNQGLTLKNCGLMQPTNFPDSRELRVQVRYDYYTTSTLAPEAMSYTNMNEEGINNVEGKRSEAPKTPVRAYLNLQRSPLHYRTITGEREPIPETALLGVRTERDDVNYKVKLDTFTVRDSSRTKALEDKCKGLENVGDNTFELSSKTSQSIKDIQSKEWLSKETSAVTQMNCQFKLSENQVNTISPTGETLTFNLESEYRVESKKERKQFTIINSACTRQNCQMVKPLSNNFKKALNAEKPTEKGFYQKQYAKCQDWDDQPGCTVRKNGFSTTPKLVKQDGNPFTVSDGKIAVKMKNLPNSATSCNTEESGISYAGIEEDELKEAVNQPSQVLNHQNGNLDVESKEDIDCGADDDGQNSESGSSSNDGSKTKSCSNYDRKSNCEANGCIWNAMQTGTECS